MNLKYVFYVLILTKVSASNSNVPRITVVGSANLDTFLAIDRLPSPGETLTLLPETQPSIDIPGGKGLNQAVACRKLSDFKYTTSFVARLGGKNDDSVIRKVLSDYGIESEHCQSDPDGTFVTGRGYVFIEKRTGRVSAVVSGGANMYGWSDLRGNEIEKKVECLLKGTTCLLLQCEVPQFVNLLVAKEAQRLNSISTAERKIIICLDVGGEDRPIDKELLACCDYILPNETELKRLVQSTDCKKTDTNMSEIIDYAKQLQKMGAKNVLVTLGSNGSILVREDGNVVQMGTCHVDEVVDETGAGDCYRAAFAVALTERIYNNQSEVLSDKCLEECMRFASAAGALAVTKEGAVPSIPDRQDVLNLLRKSYHDIDQGIRISEEIPRGGGEDETFPYTFGSRLNSMKDRPELWPNPVDNVKEWVKRQGTIRGLNCIDFNYPQHFESWTVAEAKKSLDEAGLCAGSVCLRYPSKFARGAMNHPDEHLRREAIEMTKKAAEVAKELGCNEVVIWSAYDGYDYPFQVNYQEKWDQLVQAFQECCDEYPDIKWSLEFKPTDENTRFFTCPSTGAALLMVKDVDRENFGLTLDVGHMLMSGENVSIYYAI